MSGNVSLVQYLINVGANVNLTFGRAHTYVPVSVVVTKKSVFVLSTLLRQEPLAIGYSLWIH